MASLEELRGERIKKVKLLREQGIDPYPVSSSRTHTLLEAGEKFATLKKKKKIVLAGRVMALRKQGALAFVDLFDGTGKFQAFFKSEETNQFDLFVSTVDLGDFIECEGNLFLTKRNEKTIDTRSWRMLSKALLPLPDQWSGFSDTEERFRKRYLDTLMNKEVRDRFVLRANILKELRTVLEKAGYMEVETPVLQALAGGASALPFATHHNALDIDMFLRIAPELYLKKLLVGGFPRVYEIGRNFRNEGIDVTHNPEFTMLEFYESFSDANTQRDFVEKMMKTLVSKVLKTKTLSYDGNLIDFSKPFSVISYFDLLKRYALIPNPKEATKQELLLKARQLGGDAKEGDSIPKLFDIIYKKAVRPKLVQPTFIIDYPIEYLPLAKKKPESPHLVDAFQLVVGGIELVKAFSELNDPLDQEERFLREESYKKEGEKEAQSMDADFVEALSYGCPPAGGVGIGIERLLMLLSDSKNIREVILFPTLKPKE